MRDHNFEEIEEHNLHYNIWRCPICGYEYEDVPRCNESLPCPKCGIPCKKSGETYDV